MSDCCISYDRSSTYPKKLRCPVSGGEHNEVSGRTITHHVKKAWLWNDKEQRYFFVMLLIAMSSTLVKTTQLSASLNSAVMQKIMLPINCCTIASA